MRWIRITCELWFKLGAEQVIAVTLPLSGFENAKNAAHGLNKLCKCASCTVWAEVILGEAIKTWSAQTPLCNSLVYSTHARKCHTELLSCGFRATPWPAHQCNIKTGRALTGKQSNIKQGTSDGLMRRSSEPSTDRVSSLLLGNKYGGLQ